MLGGPPCQGFSSAGLKRPDDERNKYIGDYVRFVKALQPDFLLMENVPQVIFHPQFKALIEALDKDFEIQFTVLNAAQYGVAQTRHRAFVLAFHRRLGITPAFPTPTHGFIKHFVFNYRHSRFIHPTEPRTLTVREAARLQGFSDTFEFYGTLEDQMRLVGNAVPPLLAQAIGDRVSRRCSRLLRRKSSHYSSPHSTGSFE